MAKTHEQILALIDGALQSSDEQAAGIGDPSKCIRGCGRAPFHPDDRDEPMLVCEPCWLYRLDEEADPADDPARCGDCGGMMDEHGELPPGVDLIESDDGDSLKVFIPSFFSVFCPILVGQHNGGGDLVLDYSGGSAVFILPDGTKRPTVFLRIQELGDGLVAVIVNESLTNQEVIIVDNVRHAVDVPKLTGRILDETEAVSVVLERVNADAFSNPPSGTRDDQITLSFPEAIRLITAIQNQEIRRQIAATYTKAIFDILARKHGVDVAEMDETWFDITEADALAVVSEDSWEALRVVIKILAELHHRSMCPPGGAAI